MGVSRAGLIVLIGASGVLGCADGAEVAETAGDEATQEVALGPKDGLDLPAVDLERIQVGDEAPDFSLLSYRGDVVTLSDYRGEKNVILAFYRGSW